MESTITGKKNTIDQEIERKMKKKAYRRFHIADDSAEETTGDAGCLRSSDEGRDERRRSTGREAIIGNWRNDDVA
ncbi:hypothetical protein L1887_11663 [Cichorium endivia]|nr:hypothetical protein L1887_11663 [Cichorium endivia]